MVVVDDLLIRQGELETEILCLQDAVQRLAERIVLLENFIRKKHGSLALEEVTVDFAQSRSDSKENTSNGHCGVPDIFVPGDEEFHEAPSQCILLLEHHKSDDDAVIHESGNRAAGESVSVNSSVNVLEDSNIQSVPDAVREETISVSDANGNMMDVNIYESERIPGTEINFISHVSDYAEIIPYGVNPRSGYDPVDTTMQQTSDENIPNMCCASSNEGTIRIYKPELKSFARIPSDYVDAGQEEQLSDGEKFTCTSCQRVFFDQGSLDRHVLLHASVRFHCDECDRDFNSLHNLNLHKGKHDRLQERKRRKNETVKYSRLSVNVNMTDPFKCKYCDLTFPTKSRRTGHERIHTDVKPFKCEVCGLAFRSKSGLADHAVGHVGQRNHFCHLCPSSFLRSRNLLKHIRFVHSLVQVKTISNGKLVVEFVSSEEADKLMDDRHKISENEDSTSVRLTRSQKKLQVTAPGDHLSAKGSVVPKHRRGRAKNMVPSSEQVTGDAILPSAESSKNIENCRMDNTSLEDERSQHELISV